MDLHIFKSLLLNPGTYILTYVPAQSNDSEIIKFYTCKGMGEIMTIQTGI